MGGIDYSDNFEEDEYYKKTGSHMEELIGFESHEIVHPEISFFYGVQIGIGNETTLESNKNATKTFNTETSEKRSWQFIRVLIGTEYFLTKAISLSAFYGLTSWSETYKGQDKLDGTGYMDYSIDKNGSRNYINTEPSKLIISIYF